MYNIKYVKSPQTHYGLYFPIGSFIIKDGKGSMYAVTEKINLSCMRVYMRQKHGDLYKWHVIYISKFYCTLAKELSDYISIHGQHFPKENQLTARQMQGIKSCLPKEREVRWDFSMHGHIAGGINDMEVTFTPIYWATFKNKPQCAFKRKGTPIKKKTV